MGCNHRCALSAVSRFHRVQYFFDLDHCGHHSPNLRIQFEAKTFTLVDKDRRKYTGTRTMFPQPISIWRLAGSSSTRPVLGLS